MDRRLTPANGRVAAMHLAGRIHADEYVAGEPKRIARPVVDLCSAPGASRDRQLLLGAQVTAFEDREGWSFVQAADDYVGYVASEFLSEPREPTHFVASPATHAYEAEDFKSPDLHWLPFDAHVTVLNEYKRFYETDVGFVPKRHLRPLDRPFAEPATVAQMHFGVPYLWGGNSTGGVDCSGLVAASLRACGIGCPADSDLQRAALGRDISGSPRRGDLIFWQGHVGMMVDVETMIHANAHHMATTYEPIEKAINRIKAQGDGEVLVRKRL